MIAECIIAAVKPVAISFTASRTNRIPFALMVSFVLFHFVMNVLNTCQMVNIYLFQVHS